MCKIHEGSMCNTCLYVNNVSDKNMKIMSSVIFNVLFNVYKKIIS